MRGPSRVGVWQGLADGDPDVDAIYRLTVGEPLVCPEDGDIQAFLEALRARYLAAGCGVVEDANAAGS